MFTAAVDGSLRILLVEDQEGDARLAQEALADSRRAEFQVARVARLSEALARLEAEPFDVVLLDLGLPDSIGLQTFTALHAHSPNVPVVVLSGLDDETTAVGAVRLGAQDYLVKGRYDDELLERAVRYAFERQSLLQHVERALAYAAKLVGEAEGLLALCAWCKRVRDGLGQWETIESYLASRSLGPLSHGICPHCLSEVGPESGSRSGL
jgi:DNA-binding NtrC family response regulator